MNEPCLISPGEQLRRVSEHWCQTRDGDPFAYALARRHYSARHYLEPRQRLFVGPGRKLVLLSGEGDAVFAWRQFIDDIQPPQKGHNCAIFRNEGRIKSSELIREAVAIVHLQWGPARCYTLVNPAKIRSINPGCCFKKAGWRQCGVSKSGKIILELPRPRDDARQRLLL